MTICFNRSIHIFPAMKKVLIDSSVWVSYLAEDTNSEKAYKLLTRLLSRKDGRKIMVPRIIYLEVINSLLKLERTIKEIENFKLLIRSKKKIQLVKIDERIYIKAEQLAHKVRLKTLDLFILTTIHELKINHFYSFDKKLRKAHHFINQL